MCEAGLGVCFLLGLCSEDTIGCLDALGWVIALLLLMVPSPITLVSLPLFFSGSCIHVVMWLMLLSHGDDIELKNILISSVPFEPSSH